MNGDRTHYDIAVQNVIYYAALFSKFSGQEIIRIRQEY